MNLLLAVMVTVAPHFYVPHVTPRIAPLSRSPSRLGAPLHHSTESPYRPVIPMMLLIPHGSPRPTCLDCTWTEIKAEPMGREGECLISDVFPDCMVNP